MRKKQILSERKTGDAAMIYINSSRDEADLVDILTDHGISYGEFFSTPPFPLIFFHLPPHKHATFSVTPPFSLQPPLLS